MMSPLLTFAGRPEHLQCKQCCGLVCTVARVCWPSRRYFLAQHPQAMAKLEAELDAAGLLVTAERRQPRAFTFADISKLRYLDCIIKVRAATRQPRESVYF